MSENNPLRSLEMAGYQTIDHLGKKIDSIDWNSRWQKEYPKTIKAEVESKSISTPEMKRILSDIFSKESLALSKIQGVKL